MKIIKFDNNEDWLLARRTKITGSRLSDLVVLRGDNKKIGYYQLIAERLAVSPDQENVMLRGIRLEEVAINELEAELKIKFNRDLVLWERNDNSSIAISPDGYTDDLKTAVEAKCLSSAKHIEAYLKQEIPSEYRFQVYQYFIVNDKLETLYFCFYDDRLSVKQFFYIKLERKDIQEEIKKYLEYQKKELKEIENIVKELSF